MVGLPRRQITHADDGFRYCKYDMTIVSGSARPPGVCDDAASGDRHPGSAKNLGSAKLADGRKTAAHCATIHREEIYSRIDLRGHGDDPANVTDQTSAPAVVIAFRSTEISASAAGSTSTDPTTSARPCT